MNTFLVEKGLLSDDQGITATIAKVDIPSESVKPFLDSA